MSLHESGHSSGEVSLAALLDGETQTAQDAGMTVPALLERVVIGGWPGLLGAPEAEARAWLADHLRQISEVGIPALGPRRNPRNVRRLFASLARGSTSR